MSPETNIKRIICDHMRSKQFKSVSINSIQKQPKTKEKTEIEKKAFHLTADIDRIKIKCKGKLEKAAKIMDDDIIECIKFAEEKLSESCN